MEEYFFKAILYKMTIHSFHFKPPGTFFMQIHRIKTICYVFIQFSYPWHVPCKDFRK